MDADLARLGIAPLRRFEQIVVEVEPANELALEVFFMASTQWRVAFAGPTGLDYSAVHAVMGIRGVKDRLDCFSRVRAIEYAALGEMARKAKAAGDRASGYRGSGKAAKR